MAVSGHLLILLIPVFSLCGATEYYVRPTEPTNTSCPAQPCLTLSQYINESDHYFQSNTVFKFLPGAHHMDRPLHIGDVHNVSMESLIHSKNHSHLVAQFTCEKVAAKSCIRIYMQRYYDPVDVCCAAVNVHNVSNATFEGININLQAPNMSGVVFANVSSISVQLNTACSLSSPQTELSIGILVYIANSFEIHSSSANNCSHGLELHSTNNGHVSNTTALYHHSNSDNLFYSIGTRPIGMLFFFTHNITIVNPTVMFYNFKGMALYNATNITIINTTAMYNGWSGMQLEDCININTIDTNAMYNKWEGMFLDTSVNVTLINTKVKDNFDSGIVLWKSINITMINTNASHNGLRANGVDMWYAINCTVINTITMYNGYDGMYLQETINSTVINTTAVQNGVHGIELWRNTDTTFINTTVIQNYENGITSYDTTTSTIIINLTVVGNGHIGILLYNTTRINMANVFLMHNGWRREVRTLSGDAISTADLNSLPAAVVLYYSSLYVNEFNITRNNVSAVKAFASNNSIW